jgi:hypothetical protein
MRQLFLTDQLKSSEEKNGHFTQQLCTDQLSDPLRNSQFRKKLCACVCVFVLKLKQEIK